MVLLIKDYLMDQKEFEAAIAPYTITEIDKDGQPMIVFNKRTRYNVIPINEKLRKPYAGMPHPRVMTPFGEYKSVRDCADALDLTPGGIYGRIKKSEREGTNEYYFIRDTE